MKMIKSQEIMGLSFVDSDMDNLIKVIQSRIVKQEKTFIVTANPEIVMYAESNQTYKEIIKNADFITPDGIGVVIGSKILGKKVKERLAGFDLMSNLLKLSNEENYRVYFLGATHETIEQATKNIKKRYPKIDIVGFHHGYFESTDPSIFEDIDNLKPDLIFIGLGFPRQEQWIFDHIKKVNKGVFMGVGGSFDVWAGKVKRAPIVWQRMNLEWLYRLIHQPSRWRRMLVLPMFLGKVVNLKFGEKGIK